MAESAARGDADAKAAKMHDIATAAALSNENVVREIGTMRRWLAGLSAGPGAQTSLASCGLSDRGQQHVLHTVELYAGCRAARVPPKTGGDAPLAGLVEDALKLPWNPQQRDRLSRTLHALHRGDGDADEDGKTVKQPEADDGVTTLLAVDISPESFLSLLSDETGAVREDVKADRAAARGIRAALAEGREVFVTVRGDAIVKWTVGEK